MLGVKRTPLVKCLGNLRLTPMKGRNFPLSSRNGPSKDLYKSEQSFNLKMDTIKLQGKLLENCLKKNGFQEDIQLKLKPNYKLSIKHRNVPNTRLFISQRNSEENLNTPDVGVARHSSKRIGLVEAYSVLTHEGIVRNYNEDRVSIVLNVSKPFNKIVDYWPKIFFFGVYDGHGGTKCSDYLRDHFHHYVKLPIYNR